MLFVPEEKLELNINNYSLANLIFISVSAAALYRHNGFNVSYDYLTEVIESL